MTSPRVESSCGAEVAVLRASRLRYRVGCCEVVGVPSRPGLFGPSRVASSGSSEGTLLCQAASIWLATPPTICPGRQWMRIWAFACVVRPNETKRTSMMRAGTVEPLIQEVEQFPPPSRLRGHEFTDPHWREKWRIRHRRLPEVPRSQAWNAIGATSLKKASPDGICPMGCADHGG